VRRDVEPRGVHLALHQQGRWPHQIPDRQGGNQWLSDSVSNHEELADCIAEAAQQPELEKYFKYGEIAFRRFDATSKDNVSDNDLEKYNDDFARALGVV
jgi:hypothetical protein